jgi:hypothetical protein
MDEVVVDAIDDDEGESHDDDSEESSLAAHKSVTNGNCLTEIAAVNHHRRPSLLISAYWAAG